MLVLNKIDGIPDRSLLAPVMRRYPNAIAISARTREGFDQLHEAVSHALSRSFADLDVETSAANGKLLAYLAAHGEVLDRQYDGDRVIVHVRIPQRHLGPVHQAGTTMRLHKSGELFTGEPRATAADVAIVEDVA